MKREPAAVATFFAPLFDFLDSEMAAGNVVLIHCLAGAHRAGSAGVATLMYYTGMSVREATAAAKKLRPAINRECARGAKRQGSVNSMLTRFPCR